MQIIARAGVAVRRVARYEVRVLRRIVIGLVLNLVLAVAWLAVDPLEYTDRSEVGVVVVYFVTFVLADSVTTNMLSDQVARRSADSGDRAASTGFWEGLAILVARNLTLLLVLGGPVFVVTAVLVPLSGHAGAVPAAIASEVLQISVWLGLCSIVAALFPVVLASPLAWWRERRDLRASAWRVFSVAVPYVLLWVLVPAQGRRSHLPGVGSVHRRTPGAQPFAHAHQAVGAVATGVAIWAVCIVIGAAVARLRRWRPRA